ncbi:MAG: tetratricopeptide repeat protein [Bacteroidales bacterium]
MRSFRHSYHFLLCLVLLYLASACSVEKNTGATRFYHGLTAKYNIYFNGYESFKAGVEKVNRDHNDDFVDILTLFEFSNPSSAKVCAADMERTIQKMGKLITLKSITARPEKKDNQSPRDEDFYNRKEYNEWVDDAYLLIAKARFYLREYDQARATIAFNKENSSDQEIITEGSIWLARIHTETGNTTEAMRVLGETGNPEAMTASLRSMYYTTMADILLRQKRYSEAIDPLEKAVAITKGKRQRYRLTYLLAQLYGETKQSERAISAFNDVIRMRPPYEVEFNARIGMATVFDVSSGSSEKIRSELLSMTRDAKNKDYLDQVYYALGRLSEKEGKTDEALDYFRQAAWSGGVGTNGRGRAYLALAGHYFDIPDYLNARNYYDSAVVFLDEQYPDFNGIKARSLNLSELVDQLEIIQTEDSLRRVASMNDQERSALIAGIIEQVRQEEMRMAEEGSESDMYNLGQYYESERRFRDNIEMEGQWYFYNQAALTFGRTEFRRRWGEREMEDNWRRKNKQTIQSAGEFSDERLGVEADTAVSASDPKNPEFYLRNLPVNDSLMTISRERSVNALYTAGGLFASKFNDHQKAGASWNSLISQFPEHVMVPQTYYQLYLLYHEEEPARAETYRQALLSKHPDSDFSLILTDPDYFRKQRENELRTAGLYETAYEHYLEGRYPEARSICENIIISAPEHDLIPKVKLLRALTHAASGDERTYREHLSALVKEFPSTDQAVRARELMGALDQERPELRVEEDRQIAAEIYLYEPEESHLFVLLIEDPDFNLNQATFDVINYNIDNYTNRNFRAEGQLVENRFILMTVRGFTSTDDAMDYYRNFSTLRIVRNSTTSNTKAFIITPRNLETLRKDLDPPRYLLFFRENYLNGNETK